MSRLRRPGLGQALMKKLARLGNVPKVVWVVGVGGTAVAGLAVYGIIALVAWLLSEPVVVPMGDGKPPALNMAALEKLPPDARKAALSQYGSMLAASRPVTANGAPPSREQMRAVFEKVEKLPEEDRRVVREAAMAGRREEFQQRMQADIKAYFALSEADRVAFLDKKLDEMEARRAEHEKRRAEEEKNGAKPGEGGPGEAKPGEAKPGEGGPPRNRSENDRLNRLRERLDESSPSERAERQAYFDAMRQRAQERGVSMPGPGGGPRR